MSDIARVPPWFEGIPYHHDPSFTGSWWKGTVYPQPFPEFQEDRMSRLFLGTVEWLDDWAGEWHELSIVPRGGYPSLLQRKMHEMLLELNQLLVSELFRECEFKPFQKTDALDARTL